MKVRTIVDDKITQKKRVEKGDIMIRNDFSIIVIATDCEEIDGDFLGVIISILSPSGESEFEFDSIGDLDDFDATEFTPYYGKLILECSK